MREQSRPGQRSRNRCASGAFPAVACLLIGTILGFGSAQAADLVGTWSGGGAFVLANGTKEKARCRSHFSRVSDSLYVMNAACATPSAKVTQSAQLRKVGSNSYSGSFFNPEFGVSGRIRITVKGRRQSVLLSSDAGQAAFTLSRL